LRFASGNRVFLPFNRLLDDALDPATVVRHSSSFAIDHFFGFFSLPARDLSFAASSFIALPMW
jgi:hypothetical protein